jgi:hypothetical protein
MPQVWAQSYVALPTAEIAVNMTNNQNPLNPFRFYASDEPVNLSGTINELSIGTGTEVLQVAH